MLDNFIDREPSFKEPTTPQSQYFRRSNAYAKRPIATADGGLRRINLQKKTKKGSRNISPDYQSEKAYIGRNRDDRIS